MFGSLKKIEVNYNGRLYPLHYTSIWSLTFYLNWISNLFHPMSIKSLPLSLDEKTYVSNRIIKIIFSMPHRIKKKNLKPLTSFLLSRNICLILNLHAFWNVDVASVAMLLIVTALLYSSSLSVLFLVFEGAVFLSLWVVFLWSLLRILVVKFPGLVGFYRGIRLVFWGFFFRVFHVGSYG